MFGPPPEQRPILQARANIALTSPGSHFFGLHTTRLERIFVEQDELVGALVDVKLLLSTVSRSQGK